MTADGPLTGIRVVEFAGIGPGPFAAMLLADLGADIIRIDRPGGSDPYSKKVILRGRPTATADLKCEKQKADVLKLVEKADVLIEGYRPGVMERLGLGPDAALQSNARLVYARMTGWGQTGPLAHTAGHDINYIAVSGALAAIGRKDRAVPPLNLVGDYGAGSLYLIAGILAALLSAGRTGVGQVVDCAISDGASSLMSAYSDFYDQNAWSDEREANLLDGGAPFYRTYRCSDGQEIAVGALEPQFYRQLCELIGNHDDLERQYDRTNWHDSHSRFEAIFGSRTRAEWCDLLEGTDACFAPVLSLSEAASHPHATARNTFVEVDGATFPAPAPRFSGTPTRSQHLMPNIRLADAVTQWSAS